MLKKFFIYSLLLLSLTGCITQPDIPTYTINQGDKIGYIIKAEKYPHHTHIGTTIFNNFSKTYNYDWNIQSYLENTFTTKLKGLKNISLVNLKEYNLTNEEISQLIIAKDDKWIVNPEKESLYQKLKMQLNLKAVIVIYDTTKMAHLECSAFGCSDFYSDGYGVFTRSILGMDNYFAATNFFVNAYLLTPVSSLNKNFEEINNAQVMELVSGVLTSDEENKKNNFTKPKDFDNWTKEEMSAFKPFIEQYIDDIIEQVIEVLEK
jgi:hypothetical protein